LKDEIGMGKKTGKTTKRTKKKCDRKNLKRMQINEKNKK